MTGSFESPRLHTFIQGSTVPVTLKRRQNVATARRALNRFPGEPVPRSTKVRIDRRGTGLCKRLHMVRPRQREHCRDFGSWHGPQDVIFGTVSGYRRCVLWVLPKAWPDSEGDGLWVDCLLWTVWWQSRLILFIVRYGNGGLICTNSFSGQCRQRLSPEGLKPSATTVSQHG
jgi:hypothetical protein